jgi:hypothetical protein
MELLRARVEPDYPRAMTHPGRYLSDLEYLLSMRLRIEKETGLAPEEERTWHSELIACIYRICDETAKKLFRDLKALKGQEFVPNIVGPEREEEVTREIQRFRDRALLEADIMSSEREHERRVPPSPPSAPSIYVQISQSQIAGLNVGGAVGSIQATVESLQTAGEAKIAESLKALTEAIAADDALTDSAKRESLEVVAAMGDELTKPQKDRRPGVVSAMGRGLLGLFENSSKVYASYQILKTALQAAGISLP